MGAPHGFMNHDKRSRPLEFLPGAAYDIIATTIITMITMIIM